MKFILSIIILLNSFGAFSQFYTSNSVKGEDVFNYFNDIQNGSKKNLNNFDVENEPLLKKDWNSELKVFKKNNKVLKVNSSNFHIGLNKFVTLIDQESVFVWDNKDVLYFQLDFTKFLILNNDYYKVLTEGKKIDLVLQYFLLSKQKNINPMAGAVSNETFRIKEKYFIVSGNSASKIKLNKKSLKPFFGDKFSDVEKFSKTNKLKFNKVSDLISIIDYYNNI